MKGDKKKMTIDKNIFNSDQITLLGGYQNKEKVDRLAIRIPTELKQAFQDHCRKNMLNSSEVIRKLIEKYLKETENKSPAAYFETWYKDIK